jgi:hypothetical protein
LTALVLVVLAAGTARGHALSPALLALREQGGGVIDVTWKVPLLRLTGADLRPVFPADCAVAGRENVVTDDESVTTRWQIDCGVAGLVGREIGVDGLAVAKTDALVRLELADGRALDAVLRAGEPRLVVPDRVERLELARRYVGLGIEHILTGWDHLLFVLGLVLLAAGVRPLVATVTAFTVGHSVTLTLAVLDVARVPSAPVEVLIAFSIFALAVELAREKVGEGATLMRRRPWLMAFGFGLLHGLGFAGVLREVGLPADAIPLALLGFNVGIELGQLAFVLAALLVMAALRPAATEVPRWARAVPVYAMGVLAASWMIERALPLLR